ncbi:LacI family transcriptional regulator [Streptomyces piniterrae]|uniref:LacI family transcriptional regulator n=1 Tax=Streptomyces piniterrae TaxID=2571125 RepID=A0A4U0NYV2_9ACTN|nr:LacI family transcriptional regulator [Streptomyces piniterrae]
MADVARRAGVSTSTVSRAVRGVSTVSPEARSRVERAAQELSFALSRSASSLVTGKTGRVAVLTPGLPRAPWFLGTALTGLAEGLRDADLDLLAYVITDASERAAFFDRLPARRNADAVMVMSFILTEEERERLDELDVPLVFVSQHAPGRASVYIDDAAGARRGMRYLLNLGHRRIAHLQSAAVDSFVWSAYDRLVGYREALEEAGLPYDDALVVRAELNRPGIREAIGALLSEPQMPTAIFVEADDMAFEVMSVLRSCGIDVPGQISVLGFDDHPLAEMLDLSTVAQSAWHTGHTAAGLVSSILTDPDSDPARHIALPTHLIPRGSTAPPPADRLAEAAAEGPPPPGPTGDGA